MLKLGFATLTLQKSDANKFIDVLETMMQAKALYMINKTTSVCATRCGCGIRYKLFKFGEEAVLCKNHFSLSPAT